VLYRVSGSVVLDNVQQLLRIIIILIVAIFAHRLQFLGVLGGLAFAELVGTVFILHALSNTFDGFKLGQLLPDVLRLSIATSAIVGIGYLTVYLPIPASFAGRIAAAIRLIAASLTCLLAAWPMFWLTRSFSEQEAKTLLKAIFPRKLQATAATATT